MEAIVFYLGLAAIGFWLIILLLPWQIWRVRPVLDAQISSKPVSLFDVTVVIPARDEAKVIGNTLRALGRQGVGLRIVLVDDESTDRTVDVARAAGNSQLSIIRGLPPPAGWSGKLWALEQGYTQASTPLMLLLDADIELASGTLSALREKLSEEGRRFVSLMAAPCLESVWEKLFMPAFVHFFKFLYPFSIANSDYRGLSAAAGGCILLGIEFAE